MSVLDEICAKKRIHVAERAKQISFEQIKKQAAGAPAPRGFINALQNADFPVIIAEVKKASPSKGVIRADFDPVKIAQIYEQNGAACLSVLTDEPYFQGRDDYLTQIRAAVSLPLLRKDFMVDEYQIYESRALGADCVLLIMAALDKKQAKDFLTLASDLGMDALVEVHDERELDDALALEPAMIGVNNRNLKTLEVSVQTSFTLSHKIHNWILPVSESGLESFDRLNDLSEVGFQTFLVGESLMREKDIGAALKKLRGNS